MTLPAKLLFTIVIAAFATCHVLTAFKMASILHAEGITPTMTLGGD